MVVVTTKSRREQSPVGQSHTPVGTPEPPNPSQSLTAAPVGWYPFTQRPWVGFGTLTILLFYIVLLLSFLCLVVCYGATVKFGKRSLYLYSNSCYYCLYESAILHWVRVSSIKPGNHNVTYWVLRCHSGNNKLNGNDIITWVCGHINWMERVLWFWDQLKLSMINHNTIVESAWEDMRLVN